MTALVLSAAERKQKRAEAHHLHPVVAIGHDGATAAVRREIAAALDAHGLVKLRVFSDDRAALVAKEIAARIKNELDYPGQIKVTVIREMRAVEYAR